MKSLKAYVFLIIILIPVYLQAQDYRTMEHFAEILEYTDASNNFHKYLANGSAYENTYKHALGHPFFKEDIFVTGDVVYSGLRFTNQKIKFSTYEQQLILKLETKTFGWEIILPMEFVESFTLYDYHFRKIQLADSEASYYHVLLETKDITCLYLWTKPRQQSDHREGYLSYKFGEDEAKKYILIGDDAVSFKNKRSYLKIFPEKVQPDLATYLKEQKIKLKKIQEKDMKALLIYSQGLLDQSMDQQ